MFAASVVRASRRRATAFSLPVGIALALAGSHSAPARAQNVGLAHGLAGKHLRVANTKEIESLDPALVDGSDASLVSSGLFEGLLNANEKTLAPEPGVAESHTVSKDGLTYTFKLRKNAKWSNGDALTTKDFVAAWKRALAPETGAYYAHSFDHIAGAQAYRKAKDPKAADFSKVGIEAKDALTLVVKLAKPAPYFADLLTQPVFYPVHAATLAKHGKGWTKPDAIVSNGPFKLASWQLKDKLVLAKNPAYWDAARVKLDKITFYPIEDAKTALNMYNAGEIEWARRVPTSHVQALRSHPEFHTGKMLNTVYLRFNTTRDAFKDARVRKAVSLAIDRRILVDKVAKEGQEPAYTFVTPGIKGFSSVEPIREDVAAARKLLADAGFADGKGFPTVTALFISDEQSKNVMTAISTMLKKNLNINLAPKNLERGVFYDALDALNFDVARSTWTASFNDAKSYLDKFTSENTYNNLTGYKNADYDKLITQASDSADVGRRNTLFAQAEQRLIMQDAVLVPLYYNTSINMWKKQVRGLHVNTLDVHPLKSLDLDLALARAK